MSGEETPRELWDRRRVDYFKLQNTGRDDISDSDSECFEIGSVRSRLQVTEHKILASDTPCPLIAGDNIPREVNPIVNINEDSNSSVYTVAETIETRSKRSRSSSGSEHEIVNMADGNDGSDNLSPSPESLLEEITEAEMHERIEAAEKEKEELEQKAKLISKHIEIEAKQRQLNYMRAQVQKLMDARKNASQSDVVFNPSIVEENETAQQMARVLELLQKEDELRQKAKQEEEEKQKLLEAERKRKLEQEKEEQEQRERMKREEQEHLAREREKEEKEKEEREKLEEENRKKKEQEEKQGQPGTSGTQGKADNEKLEKVYEWIQKMEEKQKEEESDKEKIRKLQAQIEEMAKSDNRRQCQMTGVSMFAGLDVLQGDGATGVDLTAKAHATMLASTTKRKRDEEEESDGESAHSKLSVNVGAKPKLQSGILVKTSHKVKYEVEWAHHWLGKEFEANPMPFNQMKLSHYMTGEADILIHCEKPEEFRSRLKLMRRLGYWSTKYDWPSARNIYAAILRGIETGRETWSFYFREYEDMLIAPSKVPVMSREGRKGRETYFCGPYQKSDCNLDAPHMARIGPEGIECMVHHVCSTCLLKDGKRLTHPNGAPNCPRFRPN